MLLIYFRVLAAVLALIATAATVRISSVGVSARYLSLAAVFVYTGFSRVDTTIIRSVVAVMGLLFLVSGLLVEFTVSILGFPYEGRGWEAGLVARFHRWLDDGMRSVTAL